ncbi:isochorismate synthase [uncultured Tenacibaculum sp.]|uniref:isochorismate synthase n=1 Tax=uncultured Tenacibaculum sp. TaxID=174713 RepID=UPI00262CBD1E|nr:isochorismate synthase [uncultured Tenacibaculum sp.]
MKIFKEIESSLKDDLPFAVYRKPNSKEVKSFFQNNATLFLSNDFNEEGFVFAPFDNSKQSILIPLRQSKILKEKVDVSEVETKILDNHDSLISNKDGHIELVKNGIEAIKDNHFKKVVLSRRELVEINNFDVVTVYERLLANYPTAFCYVWFHPEVGLWMGATPETLLDVKENEFSTMSLAGTQVYNAEKGISWGEKELDEQQLVTDYIAKKLEEVSVNLNVEQLETFKIGNLLHLRTKISGKAKDDIANVIKVLHPTPAVCGFPMQESKTFILENENYDRSFYTGFLGELNIPKKNDEKSSSLYVNLRCMQIKEDKAILYIGGGITKDSNPEKEWEETKVKSLAMKKVLL